MTSRTFPRAAGTVNYWFSLTFSDFTDFSHTECHFWGYVTRWRKFCNLNVWTPCFWDLATRLPPKRIPQHQTKKLILQAFSWDTSLPNLSVQSKNLELMCYNHLLFAQKFATLCLWCALLLDDTAYSGFLQWYTEDRSFLFIAFSGCSPAYYLI